MSDTERDEAFYAEHYGPESGWEIHRLNVCISIPAKGGSPSESLNLMREILDDADFDIRVTELDRADPTDCTHPGFTIAEECVVCGESTDLEES